MQQPSGLMFQNAYAAHAAAVVSCHVKESVVFTATPVLDSVAYYIIYYYSSVIDITLVALVVHSAVLTGRRHQVLICSNTII